LKNKKPDPGEKGRVWKKGERKEVIFFNNKDLNCTCFKTSCQYIAISKKIFLKWYCFLKNKVGKNKNYPVSSIIVLIEKYRKEEFIKKQKRTISIYYLRGGK
jgi:hypothetical protein